MRDEFRADALRNEVAGLAIAGAKTRSCCEGMACPWAETSRVAGAYERSD